MEQIAVIFDMDGTMVDNHHYHKEAWLEFCGKRGMQFNDEEFRTRIFGKTTREFLVSLFGELSARELEAYESEKERLYRELFEPHLEPLEGLRELIEELKGNGVKLGVATSAPEINLSFVLEGLAMQETFDSLMHLNLITHEKPHPEIYQTSMKNLGVKPECTVIFEDSMIGVTAGVRAGAQVVGITTSIAKDDFSEVAFTIDDFNDVSFERIKSLIAKR